jgi:transcriptional regulator with XRE-family HTH domain
MKADELNIQIGKKIRDIRKEKNIDQSYLAKHLNVTQSHISHIENGHQDAGIVGLFQIANVLQHSFTEFQPKELLHSTNNSFRDNSIQNNQGHVFAQGSLSINVGIPKNQQELDAVVDLLKKASNISR